MRRAVVMLTLLGLALRVAFVLLEPPVRLIGDEHTWTGWALELLTPEVRFDPAASRMLFYPPLYPYFLAGVLGLTASWTAVKLVQAAIGALLVPAVARVGGTLFGERAGIAAAAIVAFYPDLVWFSAHFWSETLFLVLLWWAFERLLAADAGGGRESALAAGLLFGLAILTRETALYFAPLAAVWLYWPARRARLAGAFLVSACLVVVPWTFRNSVAYGAFVPVSTAGGLNLWQGNARLTREEVYVEYAKVPGRVAKYQHARRMGLQAIRDRQPGWLFEKLRDEMPTFWEADSLALAQIDRLAYGPVAEGPRRAIGVLVVAPYLLLLAPFVLGLAGAPRRRGATLLVAFLVYYTLLHVATHGFARYRLPIMPIVFVFAALALADPRGLVARLRPRQWLVAGVLALVLGASVAPSLAEPSAQEETPPGQP